MCVPPEHRHAACARRGAKGQGVGLCGCSDGKGLCDGETGKPSAKKKNPQRLNGAEKSVVSRGKRWEGVEGKKKGQHENKAVLQRCFFFFFFCAMAHPHSQGMGKKGHVGRRRGGGEIVSPLDVRVFYALALRCPFAQAKQNVPFSKKRKKKDMKTMQRSLSACSSFVVDAASHPLLPPRHHPRTQ